MIPESYLSQMKQFDASLDLSKAVFNQDGLINDVVIIDNRVFRFVKHSWGVALLEQELRVLELLKNRLELTIPAPTRLSERCVTYTYIAGEAFTWQVFERQDAKAQELIAQQYTTLLKQLHTVPLELVQKAGIGPSDTNRTREDWLRLYRALQAEVYPHLMRHQRHYVESVFEPIATNHLKLAYTPNSSMETLLLITFSLTHSQNVLVVRLTLGRWG